MNLLSRLMWALLHPVELLLFVWALVMDTAGLIANYYTRLDWLDARFKRARADTYPIRILGLPMPAFVTRYPRTSLSRQSGRVCCHLCASTSHTWYCHVCVC